MTAREQIIETYAQWTALSALRIGAPIRSRAEVYAALRAVDFESLFDEARGSIGRSDFGEWHRSNAEAMSLREPRLQVGWASKMLNVYLKTRAYVALQGRSGLADVLHPPIDGGLWLGLRRRFGDRPDILAETHCVERIKDIRDYECYLRIVDGCRMAAAALGCSLIEVEQLWAGTEIRRMTGGSSRQKYLDSSAEISADGLYRYELARRLSRGTRTILFVGLNPSTATAAEDDPTVRREVSFARHWGFDCYMKGNLYAYRSTDPMALDHAGDPVGPKNLEALERMVRRSEVVVAAWGTTRLTRQARQIADWIASLDMTHCLDLNKDGSPKHPLYVSQDTLLQPLPRMKTGDIRG